MIDPVHVSACLITKEDRYHREIIDSVTAWPFGEILILTHCDSPHRKHELFEKAKFDYLYYQDDDCLSPIGPLLREAQAGIITCAMKPFHLRKYKESRIALLGWGAVIPKSTLGMLDYYRAAYGEDDVFCRETERILTWFNYPQRRLALPIVDLATAWAPDRLSNQPKHYDYIDIVEQRCAAIAKHFGLKATV